MRIGTNAKRFYAPEDGRILIPKGVEHSIRVVRGEECIVEEGTLPMVSFQCNFNHNAPSIQLE